MRTVPLLRQQGGEILGLRRCCSSPAFCLHGINVAQFHCHCENNSRNCFHPDNPRGFDGAATDRWIGGMDGRPNFQVQPDCLLAHRHCRPDCRCHHLASGGDSSHPNILGRMGRSSGADRGPEPGDGAVIHQSSGEADFGVPGKALPPAKKTDGSQPYPPDKSAD